MTLYDIINNLVKHGVPEYRLSLVCLNLHPLKDGVYDIVKVEEGAVQYKIRGSKKVIGFSKVALGTRVKVESVNKSRSKSSILKFKRINIRLKRVKHTVWT